MKKILVYRFEQLPKDIQEYAIDFFRSNWSEQTRMTDKSDEEIADFLESSGTHFTYEGLITDFDFLKRRQK